MKDKDLSKIVEYCTWIINKISRVKSFDDLLMMKNWFILLLF